MEESIGSRTPENPAPNVGIGRVLHLCQYFDKRMYRLLVV